MHLCLRIAGETLVIDSGKIVRRQDTAGLAVNEASAGASWRCSRLNQACLNRPEGWSGGEIESVDHVVGQQFLAGFS
jgi:hypothetical protein